MSAMMKILFLRLLRAPAVAEANGIYRDPAKIARSVSGKVAGPALDEQKQ